MTATSIPIADIRAAYELAVTELPRRTQMFARHTPLDAHAKASIPAPLLTALETLTYLGGTAQTVPLAKVNEYLDSYIGKDLPSRHKALAQELCGWVKTQLGMAHAVGTAKERRFSDQLALSSLNRFTDTNRQSHHALSHEALRDTLTPIAARFIGISHAPGMYQLSEEERGILTKEILDFSFAAPHGMQHSASRDTAAYRTDIGGISGENITNAYEHMLGCAGSPNYRNVLGAIFKELSESLSKQLPAQPIGRH